MITGWGQSMAPTTKDRDPLLVDATIREFTDDGIYLFSHDEMLYVKRLQKKGKDRLTQRISGSTIPTSWVGCCMCGMASRCEPALRADIES